MTHTQKWITGIAGALTLAFVAAGASAQPNVEGGKGQSARGAQHSTHGIRAGKGHKGQHGKRHGASDQRGNAMRQLFTPEERSAFREKMRAAKTPEARSQLAAARRAEVEKRAKEKGITLPERRGTRGRGASTGGGAATVSVAPGNASFD